MHYEGEGRSKNKVVLYNTQLGIAFFSTVAGFQP
jgi:hypothetical protein